MNATTAPGHPASALHTPAGPRLAPLDLDKLAAVEREQLALEAIDASFAGQSLADQRGDDPKSLEQHFEAVAALCDKDDFKAALPGARELVLLDLQNPHYSFLLGTCLQRLGRPQDAMASYLTASTLGLAAAVFRLAECIEALGADDDQAVLAYDAAAKANRGNELHESAIKAAQALRQAAPHGDAHH